MAEPKTSIEIERKFEVDTNTQLPTLIGVANIVRAESAGIAHLEAAYFDTAEFALAATGRALRFRTGGHDSGWHIKHRTAEGMRETQWPGEGERVNIHSLEVPRAVREHLDDVLGEGDLRVIATITTQRTTTLLYRVDESEPIAEIADDLVTTVDSRTDIERSWREWEVELLGELSPAAAEVFLDAVQQALVVSGAQPSAIAAKLQRALGQG